MINKIITLILAFMLSSAGYKAMPSDFNTMEESTSSTESTAELSPSGKASAEGKQLALLNIFKRKDLRAEGVRIYKSIKQEGNCSYIMMIKPVNRDLYNDINSKILKYLEIDKKYSPSVTENYDYNDETVMIHPIIKGERISVIYRKDKSGEITLSISGPQKALE